MIETIYDINNEIIFNREILMETISNSMCDTLIDFKERHLINNQMYKKKYYSNLDDIENKQNK